MGLELGVGIAVSLIVYFGYGPAVVLLLGDQQLTVVVARWEPGAGPLIVDDRIDALSEEERASLRTEGLEGRHGPCTPLKESPGNDGRQLDQIRPNLSAEL